MWWNLLITKYSHQCPQTTNYLFVGMSTTIFLGGNLLLGGNVPQYLAELRSKVHVGRIPHHLPRKGFSFQPCRSISGGGQPWFFIIRNHGLIHYVVADLFIVGGQKKVLKIGLHHFIVETFQYSSVKKCFQDMHGCTRSHQVMYPP